MKTVKVKGIGVQVQGISYFKNDIFEVTEEDYEPIKEYVDVLEEDEIKKENVITIKVEDENIDIEEATKELEKCLQAYVKKIKKESKVDEKEELTQLRTKAKELGIQNAGRIGKEKLIELIAEKESPMFGEEEQSQEPNEE